MIIDAKYRQYDYNNEIAETISFVDFVKLYLNHRPPHGIKKVKLEEAFMKLLRYKSSTNVTETLKENFIEVLLNRGLLLIILW